ncbi:MAG TPA: penicillin-binding protein 2 [Thermodesulfobacteriota bacterium]|nr:penicillin-binding protein 2 [Thermodesulfobacteriota bacterium]
MDFDQQITSSLSRRTVILVGFLFLSLLVIFVRLWQLQLLEGEYYFDLAKNNRIKLQEIIAPRGIIYDRNGQVLADNTPSFDISLLHEGLQDLERIIPLLSTILSLSPEEIRQRVEQTKNLSRFKPIKIKKDVSRKELGLIEFYKIDLPNVVIEVFPKRHYPLGEAMCHAIGRLGEIDETTLKNLKSSDYGLGDFIGKSGIEKAYENELKGKPGWLQFEVDALGRRKRVLSSEYPEPGNDVYLTIDADLQRFAHKTLGDKNGAVVALDPHNGEVLAYVSHPTFDPNLFSRGISSKDWNALVHSPFHPLTNKAIQGTYPPGSIFKIITAIAGLEEQIIDPQTTFFCHGRYDFINRPRCWKRGGHGTMDLYSALEQSCDVYFYSVGHRLGVDKMAYYASLFGLGKETGIVLEGEKCGLIPTTTWKKKVYGVSWQQGETLSTSIGQSFVLCTPLQVALMMNTVASNGTLYVPHLSLKVMNRAGEVLDITDTEVRSITSVSPATLAAVKEGLWRVVHGDRGTAKMVRISDLEIAGKTGTAQVIRLKEDKQDINDIPYQYRDHAWFAAFAPFTNPCISVAVLVEHGGFGSSVAGPIAREIIDYYLNTILPSKNPSIPKTLYQQSTINDVSY